MQPTLASLPRRVFGPVLPGTPADLLREPGLPPFKAPEGQPSVEIPLDKDFIAALRSNLRAASHHVAMGHEGPSFRECSWPGCQDAARLIPRLDEDGPAAADAELDAIFNRVLAALELSLPETPAARVRLVRGGTSWIVPMAQ